MSCSTRNCTCVMTLGSPNAFTFWHQSWKCPLKQKTRETLKWVAFSVFHEFETAELRITLVFEFEVLIECRIFSHNFMQCTSLFCLWFFRKKTFWKLISCQNLKFLLSGAKINSYQQNLLVLGDVYHSWIFFTKFTVCFDLLKLDFCLRIKIRQKKCQYNTVM